MVRKVDVMAAKAGGADGMDGLEREGLRFTQEMPLKEQMIFTGSSDWSPEQAEHYIDWRIQCVDSEIARLRQQLDDPAAAPCVPSRQTTARRCQATQTSYSATNMVDLVPPRVSEHEVHVEGLDPRHDGVRIAQLSDIHVGTLTPARHIRAAIAAATMAPAVSNAEVCWCAYRTGRSAA